MPIKRAAYKAIRSDKKKHLRNVSVKSNLRTLTKKVIELVNSEKPDAAKTKESLRELVSALDAAAQKGVIHRRNASRKISRMSTSVSKKLKA